MSLRDASPGLPVLLSLALATSIIGYTASPSLPCVVFLDTFPFDIVSAWKSIGSPLTPSAIAAVLVTSADVATTVSLPPGLLTSSIAVPLNDPVTSLRIICVLLVLPVPTTVCGCNTYPCAPVDGCLNSCPLTATVPVASKLTIVNGKTVYVITCTSRPDATSVLFSPLSNLNVSLISTIRPALFVSSPNITSFTENIVPATYLTYIFFLPVNTTKSL